VDNQPEVTGVILAGGQGRRMHGEDKGLIELCGKPLFLHVFTILAPQVNNVVISANRNIDVYQQQGVHVIQDVLSGYPGPLAGMLSVMETLEHEWFLFCPCDTPNIPPDLLSRLWAGRKTAIVKAVWANDGDRDHPGIALLHTSLKDPLRAYLASGERRVMQFLQHAGGHSVPFNDGKEAFANINTPDDLSHWQGNR